MVEVEEGGHKQLKCDLTDLSPDSNPGEERAAVQGCVLGASEDGSYVYFVANGVLGDGAAHGASTGDCGRTETTESEEPGKRAISMWSITTMDGTWEAPRFIAAISGTDAGPSDATIRARSARILLGPRPMVVISRSCRSAI